MKIEDCNWMQVEEYLQRDDRLVIPLGSVEQHGYLSLGVDRILSERVSVEAADPLGVLVMPSLPYGLTPYFAAYPGSPTLQVGTYSALLVDLLDSFADQGFKRFLFVNGHGGNDGGRPAVEAWAGSQAGSVRWHNWWAGERVRAVVNEIDPDATHASWFENFPWTRLAGVELPAGEKPMVTDREALRELEPAAVKAAIGDGSYGGPYQVADEEALRVWNAGVDEVRALLESLRS